MDFTRNDLSGMERRKRGRRLIFFVSYFLVKQGIDSHGCFEYRFFFFFFFFFTPTFRACVMRVKEKE